jgi:hypothetical protein
VPDTRRKQHAEYHERDARLLRRIEALERRGEPLFMKRRRRILAMRSEVAAPEEATT